MENNKLPDSVYNLVIANVADYERKSYILRHPGEFRDMSDEQARYFLENVGAIDRAFALVCQGEDRKCVVALRSDVANRRGFEGSASCAYYSVSTFKRRKRRVIYRIAQELRLV